MNELKIEYISPKKLTPYENNTRKHAADDIEQIKKSILADGFNDPIGIWGEHNLIVEGHGRQIAALELNLEKVPVIRLDHLTDDQRRDYAIRHNRTTELSTWDFSALEEEIAQLEIEGHDFDGLMFEFEKEIEKEEQERIKPEIEFTEVLREEHNYVVLYFTNSVDWLQLCSLLDIKSKQNLSTRKDGKTNGMERVSVGRVIDGAKAMEALRREFSNQYQLSEL